MQVILIVYLISLRKKLELNDECNKSIDYEFDLKRFLENESDTNFRFFSNNVNLNNIEKENDEEIKNVKQILNGNNNNEIDEINENNMKSNIISLKILLLKMEIKMNFQLKNLY